MRVYKSPRRPQKPKHTPSKKSKPLNKEELLIDILEIKHRNKRLSHENKTIKTSIRRLKAQLKKKDKAIHRVVNLSTNGSNESPRLLRDIRTDIISLQSLNDQIICLTEGVKRADTELLAITSTHKYTTIRQLEIENDLYKSEALRISNLLDKIKLSGGSPSLDSPSTSRSRGARMSPSRPKRGLRAKVSTSTMRGHSSGYSNGFSNGYRNGFSNGFSNGFGYVSNSNRKKGFSVGRNAKGTGPKPKLAWRR
ncbi:hypothetical protein AAMO2058_000169600 [Amorphochlora amoebiformis]